MANWCSNWVNLSGEPEAIKGFMTEMRELNKKSIATELGVEAIDCEGSKFMFEIYADDEDSFSFTTKWSPDFGNMRFLAKKYGVSVTNRYEEFGCGVYGEWKYDSNDDSERDVFLTDEEIYSVTSENDDCEVWSFEGEESDCREDLLSTVLERKMKLAV